MTSEDLSILLQMGGVLLDNGDFQGSLAAFDAALAIDPASKIALAGKARSLILAGRSDEGLRYLEHAARQHQDDPDMWQLLGNIALAEGQGGKAAEAFAVCQRLTGSSTETLLKLALSHYLALDLKRATGFVDLALLDDPNNADARTWKNKLGSIDSRHKMLVEVGRSHCRAGRFQQGADLLKQALEAGDSYDARLYLGKALLALGEIEGSLRELEAASVMNPEDPEGSISLAMAYAVSGRLDDAERIYRRVSKRHPDNLEALLGRAEILLGRNDTAAATEAIGRALKLAPGSPEAWLLRARALCARSKFSEARACTDHAVYLDINSALTWSTGAGILEACGELPLSRIYSEMAHRLAGGPAGKPVARELQLGELSSEAAKLGAVLSTNSEYGWAYAERAVLYQVLDEPERALYYLDLMLESRPDDVDVLCQHGGALLSLRRYADAVKSFQRALDVDPGNERAKRGVAIAREGLQTNE
jgi:superkiller protein 3